MSSRPPDGAAFTVPGTLVRELRPSSGAEPYRVLLAPPRGDPPPGGFPTLYLLDAGATFGMLVEMLRMRRNRPSVTGVAEALVVGIAHPGHHPYDRARRQRDYTPGPQEEIGPEGARAPGGAPEGGEASAFGGSAAFLDFLARDLMPAIEGEYPADPRARVLIGHSLAGLFAVTTLLRAPELFRSHLAISPSLWWAPKLLAEEVRRLSGRWPPELEPRLLVLAVGEYEQTMAPWHEVTMTDPDAVARRRGARRMVDGLRDFERDLRAAAGNHVRTLLEVHPEGDHASVVPIALSRALRGLLPLEGGRAR